MSEELAIFTASDAKYFGFLQGAVQSIRDQPPAHDVPLIVFDLGLLPEQVLWLNEKSAVLQTPKCHFEVPGRDDVPCYLRGLHARPFLRDYFPGAGCYLWLDADAWIQDWSAIELFVRGAQKRGCAVVPEIDRANRMEYGLMPYWWSVLGRCYEQAFGHTARDLASYPGLNAGVFAISSDAPHWDVWRQCLANALQRHCDLMTDQLALNYSIYRCGLFHRTEFLPAWCNWTCHFAMPAYDAEKAQFVEPCLPHHPIGIMHLTGVKFDKQAVASVQGHRFLTDLRYKGSGATSIPVNSPVPRSHIPNCVVDYVSPGLEIIVPDHGFPNMVRGDFAHCQWPYLRRDVPHPWYVDRRSPGIGFCTRDEAAILFNTAKIMKGRRALEIGSWMGWSTCHLALAGVLLDVVDPALERQDVRDSVIHSLLINRAPNSVTFVARKSPEAVSDLAVQSGQNWSLFFIDGDHTAPAPERDAEICARFAAPDAIVLFHDLVCPDVAQGLEYFRLRGWNVLVYQTMQMMGVAWRGNVDPIHHVPDPAVRWDCPEHLKGYPISGTIPRQSDDETGKRPL